MARSQKFEAGAKSKGMSMSDFLRTAAHASIAADREEGLRELREKIRELSEAASRH